ncbi:MAG: hypothetical protein FJX63_10410, partial [Alphaproteobacteria bacterium]|nr:hypothetical protein [Alphaproteobacteria bacterium]
MNRRSLIATLLALPLAGQRAVAAEGRYAFELIDGGPSGDGWLAGIRVKLDPGWKTYWRMPGDAGIPPEFDWGNSRGVTNIEVLYPLPKRLRDEGGETVGYADEVVFPVRCLAEASGAKLSLSVTLGICREICIPISTASAIDIGKEGSSSSESALVARWLEKVPPLGEPVRKAWAEAPDLLAIELAELATDIFVEGPDSAYFHAPVFSADRRQ